MGFFDRTRRARTARYRCGRRIIAVTAAAAALLAGAGIASAQGWAGPGYLMNYKNPGATMEHDLAVVGYKDGHPLYCLDEAKVHNPGDEDKGAWTTSTDINDRIAAEMVKEHEGDQSDLTQAAVSYAIHDHLDVEHAKFISMVSGGLKNGDLGTVQRTAASFWDQAKQHTPDSVQTRVVKSDLSRGYATADIKGQGGQYVSGVPWRIVMVSGADVIKWDGPTSGTTTNGPIHVAYHAIKKGKFNYQIQYASTVARRMAAASGNMQPLFQRDPNRQWFPSGVQFSGEISPLYRLDITTEQKASDIKAGASKPVHDTLKVSKTPSSSDAQFDPIDDKASVILHFDGNSRTAAKTASKQVDITDAVISKGSVDSPDFKPSDLGMTEWQSGTYWFDIQVARQGQMSEAVDTPDYEESEQTVAPDKAWTLDRKGALTTEDPAGSNKVGADGKTFLPGDPVSAVVNAHAPHGVALKQFSITDDWSDAAKYVDFSDASKAAVYYDGTDVTSQFDIRTEGTKTVATAKDSFLSKISNLKTDKIIKLIVNGTFRTDYRTAGKTDKLTNSGMESWNDHGTSTNVPAVFTWTPNPDKAWIRNTKSDGTGQWQAVIDPSKTNKTGADGHTFLDGDPVGVVVNGTVPTGLALKPDIALSDDYSKADYVWKPADTSAWKVYEADVNDYSRSTVSDIVNTGRDVTSRFTLSRKGTTITAQATDAYEQGLVGLKKGRQITLLVPGTIAIAHGKGAGQARKDAGVKAGDELTLCSTPGHKGTGDTFSNSAAEKAGGTTIPTNTPEICGYIPPTKKDVVSEASQGGDQDSVDGKVVYPGQKVEYQLLTQPKLPTDLAYAVKKVVFTDSYDQYLVPDRQTVEMVDLSTGRSIPKTKYTTKWDDANHTFVLTVTDQSLISQWRAGSNPRLQVRFEGTVSKKAPAKHKVNNKWVLTLNNSLTPSNEVDNIPPEHIPSKEDDQSAQQGDPTVSIDGKTMLLGDTGEYRITLDASQKDTAYKVYRLGIVDDYDDTYLDAKASDVRVLDQSGKDVSKKFNIQIADGTLYVFAKTVDTLIPATGETAKGDPQPVDLAAYADSAYDPLKDPAIDQSLLGQKYTVVLSYKVMKVTDGYVVRNTATQVENDQHQVTNEVSNPLTPVEPKKDVVVNVGGASAGGKDIYLNHYFLYRLRSSKRPKGLAYPKVTDWRIVDRLDPAFDRYTGAWAVYTDADLYAADGQPLFQKGEKIAGSGFDTTKLKDGGILTGNDSQLFAVFQTTDGTVIVTATDSYKKLVSDGQHEAAWSAYIQCQRLKTTAKHENRFDEYINGVKRPSNIVWTRTPDQTPSMKIEKYDLKSGLKNGDRNKTTEALDPAKDGTRIGLLITNTGKSDLHKFGMADKTIAGTGNVTWDQTDLDKLKTTTLKPGESFTVHGTLNGVKGFHTDRAKVTSTPILPCPTGDTPDIGSPQGGTTAKYCDSTPISQTDDWNGKHAPLASTGTAVLVLLPLGLSVLGLGTILIVPDRRRGEHGLRPARRR